LHCSTCLCKATLFSTLWSSWLFNSVSLKPIRPLFLLLTAGLSNLVSFSVLIKDELQLLMRFNKEFLVLLSRDLSLNTRLTFNTVSLSRAKSMA
jgi:hypothetical protein